MLYIMILPKDIPNKCLLGHLIHKALYMPCRYCLQNNSKKLLRTKMKSVYLILMLFVYNSHLPCLAQKTFERDLETYKENIKGKITLLIKNEQVNGGDSNK